MAEEPITFSCPACGIILTVPRALAGVVGPCPSCKTSIRAPLPMPALAIQPLQQPPATQQPVQPQQAPQQPIQQKSEASSSSVEPTVLHPDQQPLPSRTPASKPYVASAQETNPTSTPPPPEPQPWQQNRHNPLLRLLLGLLFLIACGALIYGLLALLPDEKVQEQAKPAEIQLSPRTALPATPQKITPPSASTQAPSFNFSNPTLLSLSLDGKAADETQKIMPGIVALEALGKFLTAKTLSERLPYIETKIPLAELENTLLAGELPAYRSILIDTQEANAVEMVLDIYYNVDFEGEDGKINPQTLLMRTRGSGQPKLVVEPFLDLFGGRLAEFASKPSSRAGTFQVIVSALATCTNEEVPNRDKKLTLKLLSRDNTREIAQAYFGRQSKIGMLLEDGSFSLSYGKAKACTVTLRWNTEEDPAKPYLEAIDLPRLDWNP